MRYNNPWMITLVAIVGLQAVYIGNIVYRQKVAGQAAAPQKVAPAKLEPISGSRLMRVTLTQKAHDRLGIKTDVLTDGTAVAAATMDPQPVRRSVPYSSLLYDLDGSTWVYKQVAPLAFERHQIQVVRIQGDNVYMSDGPPVGTAVVTQGAMEIFGTETKVGH